MPFSTMMVLKYITIAWLSLTISPDYEMKISHIDISIATSIFKKKKRLFYKCINNNLRPDNKEYVQKIKCNNTISFMKYTRGVWDLDVNVRHIYFMASTA